MLSTFAVGCYGCIPKNKSPSISVRRLGTGEETGAGVVTVGGV